MKDEDREKILKDFFIDHAETNQISIKDLKDWLGKKYVGAFSEHNQLYDFLTFVKIFLDHNVKNIYSINQEQIIDYLKNDLETLKIFKEKRGIK